MIISFNLEWVILVSLANIWKNKAYAIFARIPFKFTYFYFLLSFLPFFVPNFWGQGTITNIVYH